MRLWGNATQKLGLNGQIRLDRFAHKRGIPHEWATSCKWASGGALHPRKPAERYRFLDNHQHWRGTPQRSEGNSTKGNK